MAFGDGVAHFPTAFICLGAAVMIQIGTNLANDYYDFKKGADTEQRVGPVRVTQAGLIAPGAVMAAFIFCFSAAVGLMLPLVERGGAPIAVLGVLAVLSGIFYTAGPRPLGYLGLGELFVFIFFGPVAVAGTYYVQTFELNLAVILAGVAPGLISVGILAVNNLRDIAGDQKAGKRTLAVRFGRSFAVYEYMFVMTAAALMPVLIYALIEDHLAILASAASILFAVPLMKAVATQTDGPPLNRALGRTGRLLVLYSIIFSAGWVI
jgi:1,4-dihydroxy-2-naphthoate octaprenyltransferase